ncbi:hypothetical protein BE61_64570 [Bradyrhizobium elkanii USDA 61]|nr:hypothetical protein BLN97_03840 [Bradyrhizobium elkanii]BBC00996.1 hypothetical protein BE61_64570 [Bradyrhizobium elkanii USDA 61]GEC51010.1 hypothetical protein BEL01nite_00530 [Bradyrhizobium elkanii]
MSGATVALVRLSNEIEVFKRRTGQLNVFDGYSNAVNCGGVQEHGSDERKIDRKGCWPGALRSSFLSKVDQLLASNVLDVHSPERSLECFQHHELRASDWLTDLGKIIEMQRDQIEKDAWLLVGPGASNWSAPID